MAYNQLATDWQPAIRQQVSNPLLTSDDGAHPIDSSSVASVSSAAPTRSPTPDAASRLSDPDNTKKDAEELQSIPKILVRETDLSESDRGSMKPKSPNQNVFSIWLNEVLLLILAVCLLVAIILILNGFREKRQPDWGSITLNALIAVLATIFRAILAFVAFQIVGQVKWDWISVRPRSMRDVQVFDDASRGIFGSLNLLRLILFRIPLALAAIIVAIVSLGIGPFTQQAIQTYQCHQPVSNSSSKATIVTANRINSETVVNTFTNVQYIFNYTWQSAIQDAVVNPTLDTNIADLFNCPSGDCTFAEYSDNTNTSADEPISYASLGMCSRCANVHDLVEGPLKSANSNSGSSIIRLPVPLTSGENVTDSQLDVGGMWGIDYMSIQEVENLTWAGKYISTDMANRERYAVSRFTVLAVSQANCKKLDNGTLSCPKDVEAWGEPTDYVAATCIIYPCMKYYTGRVKNGVLSEKTVRDIPLHPQKTSEAPSSPSPAWSGVQQPCMVNGTLYTSQNMSKAETLGNDATTKVQAVPEDFYKQNPAENATYTNITAPNECVGTFDINFMYRFTDVLQSQFHATCYLDLRAGYIVRCQETNNTQNMELWYLAGLMRNRTTNYENIEDSIDSLTLRMTRELRKKGWGPYGEEAGAVSGQVWESDVCINIDWAWIALPSALCLICVVLLALTLVKTATQKQRPVWKNSVLPLLLKDHPGIGAMGINEVEKTAEGFIIRLHHGANEEPIDVLPNGRRTVE